MNEQTAIRRMKRGDIRGLAAIVQHYEVQAVRTAILITQDRALAEDVVQATFLRIFQRIDQFDETRPLAPWLLRSVANAAIQAARRQQRHVSLDAPVGAGSADGGMTLAELVPDGAPGPADEAERAELRQAVQTALAQLSPEQRATIVLRYYLGLSDDEISGQLDIAPGTVRWRLHAARKRLGVLLRRFGPDDPHYQWQEES